MMSAYMLYILIHNLKASCKTLSKVVLRYMNIAIRKVSSMQRSENEAIRTQIQPSKPKWKITDITNSQRTKKNIWSTE